MQIIMPSSLDGDKRILGFQYSLKPAGVAIGHHAIVCAMEDSDGRGYGRKIFIGREPIVQHPAHGIDECITLDKGCHAVIGTFQYQAAAITDGGQLCSHGGTQALAIKHYVVGRPAAAGQLIEHERIFIKILFTELAGALAKAGIIQHPDLIAFAGEVGGIRCITGDVLFVAVEVEDHPLRRITGGMLKLNDIEIRLFIIRDVQLGEGLIEVPGSLFVYGHGVEQQLVLEVINGNADDAIQQEEYF